MAPTAAVVGGGPAGLMAAERLAVAGLAVTVHERMPTVGRKLQVAGRGGLNLTNAEPLDAFLDRYGPARPALASAVEHLDPEALRAWSAGLGQETFVGSGGRVFPAGLRATALLRAWLRRLDELGVVLRTRSSWLGWDGEGGLRFAGPDGATTSRADLTVLALGGASWPRTGSDGGWVAALDGAGVAVTPLRPANCGFVVDWSADLRERWLGAPLKDVAVVHGHDRSRGDLVVTRRGIEGGPIYALGAAVRDAIAATGGPVVIRLDLLPEDTDDELAARLARRRPKDSVANGLRRAGLSPLAIALLREATGNHPPTDAAELGALLRALPLRLDAALPLERAISTAGGVALEEVDEHLMLRRRPGTFVAGEMLDWEAPTGGYLLQGAFSTGAAAADGALRWLGTVRP
jgi:uncharacterized flavoprotein (TIGR03862 family)